MNAAAHATIRLLLAAIATCYISSCGGGGGGGDDGGGGDVPSPSLGPALITIPYNQNGAAILDANDESFGIMEAGRTLFSQDRQVELGNYTLQENFCLNADGVNVGFLFLRDVASQQSFKLKTGTYGKEAIFAWQDESDGRLKYVDISIDNNGAAQHSQSNIAVPGEPKPLTDCSETVVINNPDPNDSYDTAPLLADPDFASGDVSSTGDVRDIYRFVPSLSTDYSMTLLFSNPDLDLQLYDSDRKVLFSSNSDLNTTELIQSDLTEGETYYLVVYAYETSGEESYTLTVDSTPPTGVIDDGDNTPENARQISDNGSYDGSVSSETDPQDYLRFMASRSAIYTFQLQFENPDIDLYLYGADLRLLRESSADGATTEPFQQTLEEGGIYYLRVHAYATSGEEDYTLSLQDGKEQEEEKRREEEEEAKRRAEEEEAKRLEEEEEAKRRAEEEEAKRLEEEEEAKRLEEEEEAKRLAEEEEAKRLAEEEEAKRRAEEEEGKRREEEEEEAKRLAEEEEAKRLAEEEEAKRRAEEEEAKRLAEEEEAKRRAEEEEAKRRAEEEEAKRLAEEEEAKRLAEEEEAKRRAEEEEAKRRAEEEEAKRLAEEEEARRLAEEEEAKRRAEEEEAKRLAEEEEAKRLAEEEEAKRLAEEEEAQRLAEEEEAKRREEQELD